jgi:2-polyprenyl-6-methoxyphenol hydroxylase-like FAD-dependent oxidoreductase
LNLALFDVDTLAQAVMKAVRDGDAAALEGYWTRWCPPVAQSRVST